MNMALIMTAVKHGATVANYLEVTDLKKDAAGKITGAELKDALSGEKIRVKAKARITIIESYRHHSHFHSV